MSFWASKFTKIECVESTTCGVRQSGVFGPLEKKYLVTNFKGSDGIGGSIGDELIRVNHLRGMQIRTEKRDHPV